jgi:dynein heavy chain 2
MFERVLKMDYSGANDSPELRINFLKSSLQKTVYLDISRSLFKEDRPIFALHMIEAILPHLFGKNEWELFTGQSMLDTEQEELQPSWVPKDRLESFKKLVVSYEILILIYRRLSHL